MATATASLTDKPDTTDEESFIILGTSPGTSLDLKCDGINGSLDKVTLDDAMKDLSGEASMAFKAHFKLNSGPSPASLMVASTMITEDKSTEELQKRFGEILDENVILKETLQKNNDSMKEQFLLIASCQEDMLKTHMLHKEKFDETKDLVDKLRQENKKLKQDVARLVEQGASSHAPSSGQSGSSGPMSALEFVTSPEDDTVDKLTAQLDLVEKQRRQVIVDNEKLTWQKESLEHIVDATTKERDDLKEKVKKLELKLSSIQDEYSAKINLLNETIIDLQTKLDMEISSAKTSRDAELEARLETMRQTGRGKISSLQNELKQAQLKILELESVKLEFSKHKSAVSDTIKMYREQIQDLQNKLKEAHTTVFQPVRFSVSTEPESGGEHAQLVANVKLYDKTLKHLADMLNLISHGSIDGLVSLLGAVASIQDMKLAEGGADQVRSSLAALRKQIDKQHDTALGNIGQVRGTLSIFEGIFKDYNELLKKEVSRRDTMRPAASNVEQLTAALVARGTEVQLLKEELQALRDQAEGRQLLAAQLDLYKSDFEAEREAREKMASVTDSINAELRTAQRRIQELNKQLEELRKSSSTSQRPTRIQTAGANQGPPRGPERPASTEPQSGTRRQSTPASATTGNMVYTCPKCLRFSSDQYRAMEDHFDFCLDDF